jgi:hypothetical protein
MPSADITHKGQGFLMHQGDNGLVIEYGFFFGGKGGNGH